MAPYFAQGQDRGEWERCRGWASVCIEPYIWWWVKLRGVSGAKSGYDVSIPYVVSGSEDPGVFKESRLGRRLRRA